MSGAGKSGNPAKSGRAAASSGVAKSAGGPPVRPAATGLDAGHVAVLAGLLVLGALVGVAGSLVQGGLFPGGLLLALLGAAARSSAGRG